jgi:cell filamentation protein
MMSPESRYDIAGAEGEFEPGSRKRVLKNNLGIKRVREMGELETELLYKALYRLQDVYSQEHTFTSEDIVRMHNLWLKDIYEWAGLYRNTNISKDGFQFAAATQIPRLMADFNGVLRKYTPCLFEREEDVIEALAVVHAELVLIHPFREGNGRVARLICSIMAYQAGYPTLDFSMIKGAKKREYFSAVQSAMGKDYEPMKEIFKSVIKRSVKLQGERKIT